jgi:hypothetical protein
MKRAVHALQCQCSAINVYSSLSATISVFFAQYQFSHRVTSDDDQYVALKAHQPNRSRKLVTIEREAEIDTDLPFLTRERW